MWKNLDRTADIIDWVIWNQKFGEWKECTAWREAAESKQANDTLPLWVAFLSSWPGIGVQKYSVFKIELGSALGNIL